jgi:putative transposase
MPWKETSPMNERVKFVAAMLQAEESFSDLCRRFGISQKQGYKWKQRYEDGGVEALVDRSRAPQSHPHAVSSEVEGLLVAARRKHPLWGPRKLLVVVRHRLGPYDAPNRIWCADFKGNFAVGGERCNPLTVSDGFSRYLLTCKALRSTTCAPVMRSFEATFREFGLSDAIRTDNGPPFSTLAVGGLSRLAIWWIRLGIRPERIMPGRPDQNGRHERMHRTLKAETARPPASSMRAQQARFERFRDEYNDVRPHEALGLPMNAFAPRFRPGAANTPRGREATALSFTSAQCSHAAPLTQLERELQLREA